MARITLERSSGANSRSYGRSKAGAHPGMNRELVTIGGTGGPKHAKGSHGGHSRANSGARDLDTVRDLDAAAQSKQHPYAVNMNDSDFFDSSSDDHRSPAARETDEYPLRRQDV